MRFCINGKGSQFHDNIFFRLAFEIQSKFRDSDSDSDAALPAPAAWKEDQRPNLITDVVKSLGRRAVRTDGLAPTCLAQFRHPFFKIIRQGLPLTFGDFLLRQCSSTITTK